MQTTEIKPITFEVTGDLVVADPCYIDKHIERSEWGVFVARAATGRWTADVEISDEGAWGERVERLTATRSEAGPTIKLEDATLGVDSGQMSIIPAASTPLDYDRLIEQYELHGWEQKFLSNNDGVVSSTGFGDGTYPLVVEYDEQGAKRISVTFMWEEEGRECLNCGADADDGDYCDRCWNEE